MSFLQTLILSLVQGITEFLPVSSSGHLNLIQYFFGLTPSLSFDILLNTATLISVLIFFRHQSQFFKNNLAYIIVGSLPAVVIGLFFKSQIESLFLTPNLLPIFFLVTSLLLLMTKNINSKNNKLNYFNAFIIGCFQALAILPGISRSGTTIFSGLLLGLSPSSAFEFSFGLFIPASIGAVFLSFSDLSNQSLLTIGNLIGFFITVIVGLAALFLLRSLLFDKKLWYFGLYTIFLSLALALMF